MSETHSTGKIVAVGSIILNFVIFVVKGFIALQVGSLALLSDAFHTLSDSASSVAVYVGLSVSEKPPDERHPHGHGRADQVAVLAVGVILFFTGLSFLTDGFESLVSGPNPLMMSERFYIYILLTAVAKEAMAETSYFIGKLKGSESLKADAWHHRGDAITTILVIGAIYGTESGFLFLDPAAGIGVALLLGYIGINYIKKSTDQLLGVKPSSEILDEIENLASDIGGVKDVHDIKVHDYGQDKAISLHMKANKESMRASHEVSHRLKEKLEERFGSTAEVHLDPLSIPRERIEELVQEQVKKYDEILETHNIEIAESKEKILISLHLVFSGDISIKKGHEIATEIEKEMKSKAEEEMKVGIEVQAHIEPDGETLSND